VDHNLCPSDVLDWSVIHSRLRLGSGLVSLRRPSAGVMDCPRQSAKHSHTGPCTYTVLLPTGGYVDADVLRRLCALDVRHDDGGANRRLHSNGQSEGAVSKSDILPSLVQERFTLSE